MSFVGCSYGHLIFFDNERCQLVNALSGAKVVPPCLPSQHLTPIWYGTLTAPIMSADSHLLVGNGHSLFHWHIGSDSWLEHLNNGRHIIQTVIFKDKIFALGHFGELFIIHLSPRLTIQQIEVVFEENRFQVPKHRRVKAWLVVCGDALLLIKLVVADGRIGSKAFQFIAFKLESLDAITKMARWVKVDRLENWAIFVSNDVRCPTWSCMNPERWGGSNNCVYFPSNQSEKPCAAIQLWQTSNDHSTYMQLLNTGGWYRRLDPTWVFPGVIPCCGQ